MASLLWSTIIKYNTCSYDNINPINGDNHSSYLINDIVLGLLAIGSYVVYVLSSIDSYCSI